MRILSHSQNFITNSSLIESVVQSCGISKNDVIVELGAGKGDITNILAKSSKKVIAIEKDPRLFAYLENRLHLENNITFVNQDILEFTFPREAYKIFGNIPFNFTSDIIRKINSLDPLPDEAYLFIQEQAALNYLGLPMAKETLKSIFTKLNFEVSITHHFRRNDFQPAPSVRVVLLKMVKHNSNIFNPTQVIEFKDFVAFAFSQTKPNLKDGIHSLFNNQALHEIYKTLKLDQKCKPSDLGFQQWLELYECFQQKTDNKGRVRIKGTFAKLQAQQKLLTKDHRTRIAKRV